MRSLGIPRQVSQDFLNDIFGKQEGNIRFDGLVDASSAEDFDKKLEEPEEHWNTRELPYCSKSARPQFYSHFCSVKANTIRHHMRKDIRESVGLGSPPTIFTTNASESMNAVLKKQVSFKKTQWPVFVKEMKQLVDTQRSEIIRALSGRGCYRLAEGYRQLGVSIEVWSKMRPDQRKKIVQKFESFKLQFSSAYDDAGPSSDITVATGGAELLRSSRSLSISEPQDSGISTIPLITLQGIWSKAQSLLQGENMITNAPGSEPRARVVISFRSDTPHIVKPKGNGQYVCDANCPQWVSSKICSHTVAVAEINNSLRHFLDWYVAYAVQPNLTTLSMSGMPSGRGKKKNQIRSQRKGKQRAASPDTFVASSVTQVAQSPSPAMSALVSTQLSPFSSPLSPLIFIRQPSPVQSSTGILNTNPFYLKFITGNIRICQGCKQSLRTMEGNIPTPPYNLTVARKERRTFRDASGTLVTPQREAAAHYHCHVVCRKAVDPAFVPQNLRIPVDILSQLLPIHREYLSGTFGLSI